ncbi:MAG: hypothetical protein HY341_01090, partial [Candidatus Kerfeldbacteria bacterium]|nr:hypothetical protein [Candidatus Kerfeldbacteria bacterium]
MQNAHQDPHDLSFLVLVVGCLLAAHVVGSVFIALAGWFRLPLLIVLDAALVLSAVVLWRRTAVPRSRATVQRGLWLHGLPLLAIAVFSIVIATGRHELPDARDDLSYLISTTTLADHGGLTFTDVYARPLNGLTRLGGDRFTSQFFPGYSAYLAGGWLVGGYGALGAGNALATAVVLAALYAIGLVLGGRRTGLLVLLFAMSSYAFAWFPQRFNSENLTMLFFWTSSLGLVLGALRREMRPLLLGLIPASALSLVRVEGIALVALYVVLLFVARRTMELAPATVRLRRAAMAFAAATFGTLVWYVIGVQSSYATAQIADFFHVDEWSLPTAAAVAVGTIVVALLAVRLFRMSAQRLTTGFSWLVTVGAGAVLGWMLLVHILPGLTADVSKNLFKTLYVGSVFDLMVVTPLFLMAVLAIFRASRAERLLVAFAFPSVVFLIEPYIAYDLPWFLRRYVPILLPTILIFAALFLTRRWAWGTLSRIGASASLAGLLLAQTVPIVGFREHQGVNQQVAALAATYTDEDFVVTDAAISERKWVTAMHFLYGTHALHSATRYSADELRTLMAQHARVQYLFPIERESDIRALLACDDVRPVTFDYAHLIERNRITGYIRDHQV